MKQTNIKQSEARLMVFLTQCKPEQSYANYISAKLGIDYAYLLHIIKGMKIKGWLVAHKGYGKVFYKLAADAPTDQAKHQLAKR